MVMVLELGFGRGESMLDALAEALGGAEYTKDAHIRVMKRVMAHPDVAAMSARTVRTTVRINDNHIVLSSEGFPEEDPHVLTLLRDIEKPENWILYNLCPRSPNGVVAYRLKGDEATVIRHASVLVDIAMDVIKMDELPADFWKPKSRREED